MTEAMQRGHSICKSGEKVISDPGLGVMKADRSGVGRCLRLCYDHS